MTQTTNQILYTNQVFLSHIIFPRIPYSFVIWLESWVVLALCHLVPEGS